MDFNKCKLGLARSLVAATVFGLASCITTTSGPEPEKWAPEERAEAHVNLGMTYLRENQFDTAETEFNLALQTNPKSDTCLLYTSPSPRDA